MMKSTVINLIGGPGIGKSTLAADIFSKLKKQHYSCELVSEYPKEVTWEDNQRLLENQIIIFSEQFRRVWRLDGKVKYIVTDSPLIMSSVYFEYYLDKTKKQFTDHYKKLSIDFFDETFDQFNNLNFLLSRQFKYSDEGRNESIDEASKLDSKLTKKLIDRGYTYYSVPSYLDDAERVERICKEIRIKTE